MLLLIIAVYGLATSHVFNPAATPVVRAVVIIADRGTQQRTGDGQYCFAATPAELVTDHTTDDATGKWCSIATTPVVVAGDPFRPALGHRVCHFNGFILWLCLEDPGLVNEIVS